MRFFKIRTEPETLARGPAVETAASGALSVPPEGWLRLSRPRDVFITCVFLLVTIGTVMVFSASAFLPSSGGDPFLFLRRQLIWLCVAVAGCVFVKQIRLSLFQRYYWQPLLVSSVLLAVVLIPGVGHEVNESRRWLRPASGLQFQPSELAKFAMILFVAGFMSANPARRRAFFKGFLVVCMATLPVLVLIMAEPDFGTAMFVLGLAVVVLFLSGVKTFYFLGSALIFLPLVSVSAWLRWDVVQNRLLGFLDPEKVYQVKHSLIALGSGGWLGAGLGASGQKLRYLPEPHTDFILAILGEEFGFLGCVAVILLFALLLWSGLGMVWRTRDLFGFLLGSGIVISLAFQSAINMAVVTASAPTKGIPLPFVTFGGSGLCMALAQVGILLSIEKQSRNRSPGTSMIQENGADESDE